MSIFERAGAQCPEWDERRGIGFGVSVHNIRKVWKAISDYPAASIDEVAAQTGLSRASVSYALDALEAQNPPKVSREGRGKSRARRLLVSFYGESFEE